MAATAIGVAPDLETAVASMTRIDHRIEPRPEVAETYSRLFDAYVALYPATAPILRGLS
jgi:sugar (pentulose or hexulose) kinase